MNKNATIMSFMITIYNIFNTFEYNAHIWLEKECSVKRPKLGPTKPPGAEN